jgi:hypothetical protein
MRKIERMIRTFLKKNYPEWTLVEQQKRNAHYTISNGTRKISASGSPKNNTTVIKNVKQQIERIERGTH